MNKQPKEIGMILLSGGIDSVVAMKIAREEREELEAIHFSYNQQTKEQELAKARKLAKENNIELKNIDLGPLFDKFALGTMKDKEYKKEQISDELGHSVGYVHMRNLLFLTIAAAKADSIYRGKEITLYIGAQKDDRENYPDCRPAFIESAKKAIDKSTDKNIFKINSPLLNKTKEEIIKIAREHDMDIEETISCYNLNQGEPCGECPACIERKRALNKK